MKSREDLMLPLSGEISSHCKDSDLLFVGRVGDASRLILYTGNGEINLSYDEAVELRKFLIRFEGFIEHICEMREWE